MAQIPTTLRPWVEARRRDRLSHAHIQMALELGMNPKKLGKLDNHHEEPWKAPLPEFIESLYQRRFNRLCPDPVRSIEQLAAAFAQKKAERRARNAEQRIIEREKSKE